MGYLFFYAERFLWVLWNLCEIYSLLAMIIFFTQRPQRAQRVIPFRITRLRWSGRKLRYDKSAQRVLSTPSPLRGTPACLRGRKWVIALVSCNYSLPSGASEVFRRSTECASVPREGRTFQFDARTGWGGVHTL